MTIVQRNVDATFETGKTVEPVVGLSAWCATRSLETYPKDRGISGEDRGCFGILFFDNCVLILRGGRMLLYAGFSGDERHVDW